MSEGG